MSSQATPDFNWDWPGEHPVSSTDHNAVDAANKRIVAEGYKEVKKKYWERNH
jgi:hypothetical protein